MISENDIGYIVNWSQILNSYYWNEYNNDKDPDLLAFLYEKISMLSSFSQLEIDKAKKYFDTNLLDIKSILRNVKDLQHKDIGIIRTGLVDVAKQDISSEKEKLEALIERRKTIHAQIKNDQYLEKDSLEIIKNEISSITKIKKEKVIRPMFLKYCAEGEYKYEWFDTPMDFVIGVLTENVKRANSTNNILFIEILRPGNMSKSNRKQIPFIKEIVAQANTNIKRLHADKDRDENEDVNLIYIFNGFAIDQPMSTT